MAAALTVKDLVVTQPTPRGAVRVVKGIGFEVARGECLGIVGESGAGKSQALLALLGIAGDDAKVEGEARLEGASLPADAPRLRGSRISMVFQDPMTALTPHLRIGAQIAEPLRLHAGMSRTAARAKALDLLAQVQLPDPVRVHDSYPHELSGGMRQRALIAMALACDPVVLLADEPTTALDVSVQAQVLALLWRLKRERGLGMVLVSHDFGVVAGIADRVAVMYAGRIVETGTTLQVMLEPRHPYTRALLAATPRIDRPVEGGVAPIPGRPPDPRDEALGCDFAPRCAVAADICRKGRPALAERGGRTVACHLVEGDA